MADVRRALAVAPNGPDLRECPEAVKPLSGRELRFVEALAGGDGLSQAATAAGVSYRTARRWKVKPRIVAAVRSRVNENIAIGRAILAGGMAKASRALVSMADGSVAAEAARVSACRAVVEAAARLVALEEIESRLVELEERFARGGRL